MFVCRVLPRVNLKAASYAGGGRRIENAALRLAL